MHVFDVVKRKNEAGFGIVFARRVGLDGAPDALVVDGLGDAAELDSQLQVGDQLVALNGRDCREMPVIAVVELLRAAPCGDNVLRFERQSGSDGEQDDARPKAVASSLMDALLKVKSRIKAEIEGDEEELRREQEENARFEKQWLGEFDLLKAEYASRWETCTYTAEEFCGLIYHASDAQAQQRLLARYPTLMEAWRDADATTSSLRQRLEWPAACVTYDGPLQYEDRGGERSLHAGSENPIQCSPSLQGALSVLRAEFLWSRAQLEALARRLEREQIYSCRELRDALAQRNGARFEREFQCTAYPRLTRAACQALERSAAVIERRDESLRDASMAPLRVNP
ncbi:hypothetical protein P43SY_001971 [Pythium insidiosum]|uniref:PDZ domain-containing protein n=1 Tax=Pythium insidiosum TaxID=114742 RepID=A0AAD5MB18_PYTIN|nr:hypothetical protein P43SY_001971 [Pythium insidiosum]